MKRFSVLMGLGAVGLALLVPPALAEVPHVMNMQGILRDGGGDPVADSSYDVTFTIYDSAAGGNVLWTESHLLSTSDGLFSVLLGSVTPVPDSIFFDTSRYLGITVPPDPEMTPRQLLSSTGYSFVSSQWTSVGANLFRLSGMVGLGIPTPTVHLHAGSEGSEGTPSYIAGTMIAAQATNPDNWTHVAIISGSLGRARLNFGDALNDDQGIVSYDNSSDAMSFSTASTEKMRITSTGLVGIGTTTPQSPMVIQGASNWGVAEVVGSGTNVESSIGFRSSNLAKGALGTWVLGVNNNAGLPNAFSLYAASGLGAGSQALTVLTNGFVGIGTFSPNVPLHVHDPNNTINGSRIQLTQAVAGSGLFDGTAVIGASNRSFLWNYENGPLMIGTNNVERVKVDSVGRVGVGTSSPQGALDVVSTTGAFIVPRMTTTQRDALTPVNGMIVYNTTTNQFNFREASVWVTK